MGKLRGVTRAGGSERVLRIRRLYLAEEQKEDLGTSYCPVLARGAQREEGMKLHGDEGRLIPEGVGEAQSSHPTPSPGHSGPELALLSDGDLTMTT